MKLQVSYTKIKDYSDTEIKLTKLEIICKR